VLDVKVRESGRVVSMAALVATGVATSGERRILGLELAPGNDEDSAWPAFTLGLVERGLSSVRLVCSVSRRRLGRPGTLRSGPNRSLERVADRAHSASRDEGACSCHRT
jgi:hypothetical protein